MTDVQDLAESTLYFGSPLFFFFFFPKLNLDS